MPTPPPEVDPRVALARIITLSGKAHAALVDEHEGDFTQAVLELADVADTLRDLVLAW
jgi:hypothetical protein